MRSTSRHQLLWTFPTARLYWTDVIKGTVESILLNGKDRVVVKKYGYQNGILHDRPFAVDVFEDYLFVVGKPNGTVWKMHKFGQKPEILVKKVQILSSGGKLKMVHPIKRYGPKTTSNPCSLYPCNKEMCIPINSTSYECSCPSRTEVYFNGQCVKLPFARAKCAYGQECLNGGKCSGRYCQCKIGFHGEKCEKTLCTDYCIGNHTCTLLDDGHSMALVPKCGCGIEYAGKRCERYKCAGRCGSHGVCRVDNFTGQPTCKCDFGWEGADCEQQLDTCQPSFCFNNGRCIQTLSGMPYCECPDGYRGRRCENCVTVSTADEIICLNGGRCKSRERCVCAHGYSGHNCSQDLCENYCMNGGTCLRKVPRFALTQEKHRVACQCLPGYSGQQCQFDMCSQDKDYCMNGGICRHHLNSTATCECPSKFDGKRCEEKRICHDWCLNESECYDKSDLEWGCRCHENYRGERCDQLDVCGGCENGGICRLDEHHGPVCDCPRGLAGSRCEKISAVNCHELDCLNDGFCAMTPIDRPVCNCYVGYDGLVCSEASCEGYCIGENSTCYMIHGQPMCKCPDPRTGDRCQYLPTVILQPFHDPHSNFFRVSLLIITVVLLITVATVVLKKKRRESQFKHTRMNEDVADAHMDEFNNPAFLAGGDDDATEVTNFTNPMYENVYNDTVTSDAGTIIKPNAQAEERGLLNGEEA